MVNAVETVCAGRFELSAVIAREEVAGGAAQHAFISGQPAQPGLMRESKDLIGDAAFRRPHALRPHAEDLLMQRNGPRDLLLRVLRMTEALPGQRQSSMGGRTCIGITQQREDRVIERRGGDFDCAALRRRGVSRQHFREQLALFADNELLILKRVTAALVDESAYVRIIEKKFIHPGNLREHLQVTYVTVFEKEGGLADVGGEALQVFPQLTVTRIARDHVLQVGLEEILDGKLPFVKIELGGGPGGNLQKRVMRFALNVFLNLDHQRRNKVEGLVNAGKFIQQLHHAEIVFECMEPYPGQPVLSGDQVLIVRLVHVPQKQETYDWHDGICTMNNITNTSVKLF